MAAVVSHGGTGTWGGNYFTSIDTEKGTSTILCHYKYREVFDTLMAQMEDIMTLPFTLHPAHLPAVYLGNKGRKLGQVSDSNHRSSTALLHDMEKWELNDDHDNLNIEANAKKALRIQENCVGLLIRLGEIIDMNRFLMHMIQTISDEKLCVFDVVLSETFEGMGKAITKMIELNVQDLQDVRRKTEFSVSWAKTVQNWVRFQI